MRIEIDWIRIFQDPLILAITIFLSLWIIITLVRIYRMDEYRLDKKITSEQTFTTIIGSFWITAFSIILFIAIVTCIIELYRHLQSIGAVSIDW